MDGMFWHFYMPEYSNYGERLTSFSFIKPANWIRGYEKRTQEGGSERGSIGDWAIVHWEALNWRIGIDGFDSNMPWVLDLVFFTASHTCPVQLC